MYIPPGFTLITCEPVDETALQSWAVLNGGVWHPVSEGHYGNRQAYVAWDFGPRQDMDAKLGTLSEEDKDEWSPLMHKPPQGVVTIKMYDGSDDEYAPSLAVLQSLPAQWDVYAYDIGAWEWVSALLRDLLPTERIIRHEPPPPGPPPAWVWVHGKYQRNEEVQ